MIKKTVLSPRFSSANETKSEDEEFNRFQKDLFGNETDKRKNFLAAIDRMDTLIEKIFSEASETTNTSDKDSIKSALENFRNHVKNNDKTALSAYDAFMKLVFVLEYGDADITTKKETMLGLVDPLKRCVQGAAGEIYSRAIGLNSQLMPDKITAFANNLINKYFYKDGGNTDSIHMRNQYFISAFNLGLSILPNPAKESYGRPPDENTMQERINQDYTLSNLLAELYDQSIANLAAIKAIGNCVTVNPNSPTNKRALELFKFCNLTADDLYYFYRVEGIDNFGGIAALCDAIVESDIDEIIIIKSEEDKSKLTPNNFGIKYIENPNIICVYRKINDTIEQYTIKEPTELIDELIGKKTTIEPFDFANIFYDLFKTQDSKNLKPDQKSILDKIEINHDFLEYKIYKQLIKDRMLHNVENLENILAPESLGPQTELKPTKEGKYDVIKIYSHYEDEKFFMESKKYFEINNKYSHAENIENTIAELKTIEEIIEFIKLNFRDITNLNKELYKKTINQFYNDIYTKYGIDGAIRFVEELNNKNYSYATMINKDKINDLLYEITDTNNRKTEEQILQCVSCYLMCLQARNTIYDYEEKVNEIYSYITKHYDLNSIVKFIDIVSKQKKRNNLNLNSDNLNNLSEQIIKVDDLIPEEQIFKLATIYISQIPQDKMIDYKPQINQICNALYTKYGIDSMTKFMQMVSKKQSTQIINNENLNHLLANILKTDLSDTHDNIFNLANVYLFCIPTDEINNYREEINQICSFIYKNYSANSMIYFIDLLEKRQKGLFKIFNEENIGNLAASIISSEKSTEDYKVLNLARRYVICIPPESENKYKKQINEICNSIYNNHGIENMISFVYMLEEKQQSLLQSLDKDNLNYILEHVKKNIKKTHHLDTNTLELITLYINSLSEEKASTEYDSEVNDIFNIFYKTHGIESTAEIVKNYEAHIFNSIKPDLKDKLVKFYTLKNIDFLLNKYLGYIQPEKKYQEELNKIITHLIKSRHFGQVDKLITSESSKRKIFSEHLYPETKLSIIQMCKKINYPSQRLRILESAIFSENFLQSLEKKIKTSPNIVKKMLKDLVIPSNDYNTNDTLLDSPSIMSQIHSKKYPLLEQMFDEVNSSSLAIPKSVEIESFNYESIENQINQLEKIKKTRILKQSLSRVAIVSMFVGITVGLIFLPISIVASLASVPVAFFVSGVFLLHGNLKKLKYETFDIKQNNALTKLYNLRKDFKASVQKFITSKNSFQKDASNNIVIEFNQKHTPLNQVNNSSLTYIINQGANLLSSALNPKNESLEPPITLTKSGITTVLENTLFCCGQLLSNKQPFEKQAYENVFTILVTAMKSTPYKLSALSFFNENLQKNSDAELLFKQVCVEQKIDYRSLVETLEQHKPAVTFTQPSIMYLKNEPENSKPNQYEKLLDKLKNKSLKKLGLNSQDELDKICQCIYIALNDDENIAKVNIKKSPHKSIIYSIGLLAKNQKLCEKHNLNPQQVAKIHKLILPKNKNATSANSRPKG